MAKSDSPTRAKDSEPPADHEDGELRLNIGPRLRHARRVKGYRLGELATRAQCSESLLSKVENGKATPSLSLLHRLARALDTNIPWFFTQDDEVYDIVARRDQRTVIEFRNFRETEGTTVERLAPSYSGQLLQAMLFIVAPGGHSLDAIEHEGEELGYVLDGQLELVVDDKTYLLNKGDTFQFRSERPHGYRNPGESTARVLWINTPPTY